MKENLSEASVVPLLNYFGRLIPLNKEEKAEARHALPLLGNSLLYGMRDSIY